MHQLTSRSGLAFVAIALSALAAGYVAGAALHGVHPGPRRSVQHLLAWGRHVFARSDAAYVDVGRRVYETRCTVCHGLTRGHAGSLARASFEKGGELGVYKSIAHAASLGDMPAFGQMLSDTEILATVAYLGATRDESTTTPSTATALADGRYEYVVQTGGVIIYDIDAGFVPVATIRVPYLRNTRGIAASVETGLLYLSYWGDRLGPDRRSSGDKLLAIDLARALPIWTREIRPGIDSFAVTSDGTKIYMPAGEHGEHWRDWIVLDARTGEEQKRIEFASGPHNTVVSPDGSRAYLAAIGHDHLGVLDTRTDTVIAQVGPFGERLRPLALTGDGRFALVNVNFLSGFEVADLVTGKVLHRVRAEGWPWVDPKLPRTQSHGVALSPDEREAWVNDASNVRVQIFDVSALPESPRHLGSVDVRPPDAPDPPSPEMLPKWIRFTRDGRWVHVSNGAIVDARTREVRMWIAPSRYFIEVHWRDGKPSAAFSRYGNGYRGAAGSPP
jgi:mono/diheme cytochrome c family protein